MSSMVIVGASLAGVHAAQAARRAGFDGEIVLIGDEEHRPYDRPPLSKEFLAAEPDDGYDEARLTLRPVADPETLSLTMRLGRRAVSLDPDARTVGLAGGERVGYDGLVIATGARPRPLPGSVLGDQAADRTISGLHVLRSLDDARGLRRQLVDGAEHVLVCGAGFIGSEVAASARTLGVDVTLVDQAEVPMGRALDHQVGSEVADLHRDNGVDVRLGTGVERLELGDDHSVRGAILGDGTHIDVDAVVVGIGVVPNTDWLDGSGLTVDDGVVLDETCRAGPRIVAAGDVARWPNTLYEGRLMRVEHWDNAVDQGTYVGRRLLVEMGVGATVDAAGDENGDAGRVAPFQPVPWFWSDLYDRKIQLAGIATDETHVVQGSITERRFVQLQLGERTEDEAERPVLGVLCWNRPRQAIVARQLLAQGLTVAEAAEKLG